MEFGALVPIAKTKNKKQNKNKKAVCDSFKRVLDKFRPQFQEHVVDTTKQKTV